MGFCPRSGSMLAGCSCPLFPGDAIQSQESSPDHLCPPTEWLDEKLSAPSSMLKGVV